MAYVNYSNQILGPQTYTPIAGGIPLHVLPPGWINANSDKYGWDVKADGSTDDGPELEKCLQFACDHNLNVFFPSKRYRVATPMVVTASGASYDANMILAGAFKSQIWQDSGETMVDLLTFKSTTAGGVIRNIQIRDLYFLRGDKALSFLGCENVTVRRCQFFDPETCIYVGENDISATLAASKHVILRDSHFAHNGANIGIHIYGDVLQCIVAGNSIGEKIGTGVKVENSTVNPRELIIAVNTFQSIWDKGIEITDIARSVLFANSIEMNASQSPSHALDLGEGDKNVVAYTKVQGGDPSQIRIARKNNILVGSQLFAPDGTVSILLTSTASDNLVVSNQHDGTIDDQEGSTNVFATNVTY